MTEGFDKLAPTTPNRVHVDWDAARQRIHEDVVARASHLVRRRLVGSAAVFVLVAAAVGASLVQGGGGSRDAVPATTRNIGQNPQTPSPSAPSDTSDPASSPFPSSSPGLSESPGASPSVFLPPDSLVHGHPDLCEKPVEGSVPEGPDQLATAAFEIPGFQFLWESRQQGTFNVAVLGDTAAALETLRANYHGLLCVGTLEGPTRVEVEAARTHVEEVTQELTMSAVLTPDGVRVELVLPPDVYQDPAVHEAIKSAAGDEVAPWLVIQPPLAQTQEVAPGDPERISEVLFNAGLAVPGVYAGSELLPDGRVQILYLDTHDRAQEFISQVNASAGAAARAIQWTGTYYSQDLIMELSQAATAEARAKGIDVHGGSLDADAREFQVFTPKPPADPFLTDRYIGDVRITVRLVPGEFLLETGEG